jgi:exopolysaccharide biosynthesis WecB/TagA/CpsF family protein
MQKITDILGVGIVNLSASELRAQIMDFAVVGKAKIVLYVNANSINLAVKDANFRKMLNSADILHADGWGVILASHMVKGQLKERIVITDFFVDFCEELSKEKMSLYLLGGQPGIAEQAKLRLQQGNPALNIVGQSHGYFKPEDNEKVIAEINNCRPDILIVGMGTPKQEKWIYDNRNRLNVPLCWAVGGLFDFISGNLKRAPKLLCDWHLEWLFRLLQEPKRLWKRYLISSPLFLIRVFRYSGYKNRNLN